MDVDTLRNYLDDPAAAEPWLRELGLTNTARALANLVAMADSGMTLDLLAVVCDQLAQWLPLSPDADMALNNLERFVVAARNRLAVATLFQRDPASLRTLVQIFSTSQYLSDLLIADRESLDLLRLTEGQPMARGALVAELVAEVNALQHDTAVLAALRRFKYRETLRIGYGDISREQGLPTVTRQISFVADAVLEAALGAAWRKTRQLHGTPLRADGQPASMVILALGKLGGVELNYSSDIDLIFLYDEEGRTDTRRPLTNAEFFTHLARECVRLLTEQTDLGAAYRVDLRLRPEGERGPVALGVVAALRYYDLRGRTWERQAFIKARPAAGNFELGYDFLTKLRPWIYRRYLSRADISGIKTLKRRIERRTHGQGIDTRDVKIGHGGIRDIEFVIQFLQLLNGANLPELQTGNTLDAIAQLENVGCLSNLERTLLEENYSFLRKIEHRLQIMFDLQTHLLPSAPGELRKLARRMGYVDVPRRTALEAFEADYRAKTMLNRRILDHLLHDAFTDDQETEAEVDLVLDPKPPEQRVAEVLGKYPFRDVKQAYRNLASLGEENIRFLSTRRCRHFLASIAPQLLAAIAATPDPDSTLVNLGRASASLGGKGVLWELFSFNPPSLRLYVDLCAYSPFLCELLTSNPGMSDQLMDSLVLDKLPTPELLRAQLADLCLHAEDLDPILNSFKIDQQLCVGVRDLLGKEDIQATTAALSAIAETCLGQIAQHHYDRLVRKYGVPIVADDSPIHPHREGQPCELVILAMGKFGGREMNYYSDLDLVFLYESDGHTAAPGPDVDVESTTNQHFFSELAQGIITTTSRLSPYGRLYEVDARLRPTGKSGALATSFAEFARYHTEHRAQLWERQALVKARVVYGSKPVAGAANALVGTVAFDHPWQAVDADAIRQMRRRQEQAAAPNDLKRGPGGIVDIEFLVQMLQLKHGRAAPTLRIANTLDALGALGAAGCLDADDVRFFTDSYRFLRTLENRLCLVSTTPQSRLPDEATELAKLTHLFRYTNNETLRAEYTLLTEAIRQRFDRLFDAAGQE